MLLVRSVRAFYAITHHKNIACQDIAKSERRAQQRRMTKVALILSHIAALLFSFSCHLAYTLSDLATHFAGALLMLLLRWMTGVRACVAFLCVLAGARAQKILYIRLSAVP